MSAARLVVYTDGSCLKQSNKALRRAGYSVFFGVGDARNVSEPVADGGKHTNQVGEMMAVIAALERTDRSQPLLIISDSEYVIKGLVGMNGAEPWHKRWAANGWRNATNKPVANRALWERMIKAATRRDLQMQHQRAHVGNRGNESADALAKNGARAAQKRKRPTSDNE